ncbi:MAG: hypothetical protein AAF288_12885 [Planctomycetota bacterium]
MKSKLMAPVCAIVAAAGVGFYSVPFAQADCPNRDKHLVESQGDKITETDACSDGATICVVSKLRYDINQYNCNGLDPITGEGMDPGKLCEVVEDAVLINTYIGGGCLEEEEGGQLVITCIAPVLSNGPTGITRDNSAYSQDCDEPQK